MSDRVGLVVFECSSDILALFGHYQCVLGCPLYTLVLFGHNEYVCLVVHCACWYFLVTICMCLVVHCARRDRATFWSLSICVWLSIVHRCWMFASGTAYSTVFSTDKT